MAACEQSADVCFERHFGIDGRLSQAQRKVTTNRRFGFSGLFSNNHTIGSLKSRFSQPIPRALPVSRNIQKYSVK